ncbi:unnamed protein product [Allacma fusca]|uniref:Uncharacterized protein n=1 Tax=Allacma fusca TaxID=39272 RepID=A0A8J2NSL6_9HEXA|nr:unnamed protein product [Allacma fusca]
METLSGVFAGWFWKDTYLNWLTRFWHSWDLLRVAIMGDMDTVEETFFNGADISVTLGQTKAVQSNQDLVDKLKIT